MTQAPYTGPAYFLVNATSEHSFDVTDMHGKRIATYPNAELAIKVAKDMDKQALRAYLKTQKRK